MVCAVKFWLVVYMLVLLQQKWYMKHKYISNSCYYIEIYRKFQNRLLIFRIQLRYLLSLSVNKKKISSTLEQNILMFSSLMDCSAHTTCECVRVHKQMMSTAIQWNWFLLKIHFSPLIKYTTAATTTTHVNFFQTTHKLIRHKTKTKSSNYSHQLATKCTLHRDRLSDFIASAQVSDESIQLSSAGLRWECGIAHSCVSLFFEL